MLDASKRMPHSRINAFVKLASMVPCVKRDYLTAGQAIVVVMEYAGSVSRDLYVHAMPSITAIDARVFQTSARPMCVRIAVSAFPVQMHQEGVSVVPAVPGIKVSSVSSITTNAHRIHA